MTTSHPFLPAEVLPTIREHLIGDGFPLVFDLEASHGSWIHDALTGEEFLDFYSFFASLPLGFQHRALRREDSRRRLLDAATHKPANSDAFSPEYALFTRTFSQRALVPPFRHLFFIEGGALAVENALKTAFDWKVRRNLAAGRGESGQRVLHFREAFHGRSGYTLSLTNTLRVKTDYFPKFDWPRVRNPKLRFPLDRSEEERVAGEETEALREIREAFARHPHDIAAIIIEPIQGEGGDNHFRGEFLRELRRVADAEDALLIFDEVQTGFGLTGQLWAFEHFDVVPDILCFGKKAQVSGIMAGPRIDEVEDNVFRVSSRLNSTWGGNLVDMVRCAIVLEAMEEDGLVEKAARVGEALLADLRAAAERYPDRVSNVRGRGLMVAFDCPNAESRKRLLDRCLAHRLLALPCGTRSVRFRPALTLSREEAAEGVRRLEAALSDG